MKRLLPLVVLVCLAVGCGSSHACSGGRETVLRAVSRHGETVTPAGMKLARQMLVNRVSTIGVVGSPKVEIRGDELVISGAGVSSNVARVVSETGNLQFFDFEKDLAAPTVENGHPTPYPTLYSLLYALAVAGSDGLPDAYYLFDGGSPHRVLQGPTGRIEELLAPYGGKLPDRAKIYTVPANREVVSGTRATFTTATKPVKRSPDGMYWYLVKLPPEITGNDIRESTVTAGTDPNTGKAQVNLGFTRHGAKEFQAITKAEYNRGRVVAGLHGSAGEFDERYAQHNAVVLDGRLQATPFIDYTDNALSLGIAGAQAVIYRDSVSDANRLALVLQSGSLPYRFELVSSKLCAR